jgi:uncharacterized membrane protein YeaQ/YmgE (transglycosylase-associated protein family)
MKMGLEIPAYSVDHVRFDDIAGRSGFVVDTVLWLVLGLIAGVAAMFAIYRSFPSKAQGWIAALVIGIVGGWLGGWLTDLIHLEAVSWLGSLVVAFAGACLLLWILRKALPASA